MANYLAEQLKEDGIRRGNTVVAASNKEMLQLLHSGAVDILSETAFSSVYLVEQGVAEILLREWKKGIASYRSVFITRQGSNIRSIDDLRGKKIAFEDAGSTSGFLLPLAILKRRGLETVEGKPLDSRRPGKVSYAFAVEEINIAAWVARGIADAGVFSNQDWEDIARTPAPLKSDLVIFHRSEPLIRSTILASTRLGSKRKERIKRILLRIHEDPAGRAALKRYGKIARYDDILGKAADGFNLAHQLYPFVKDEVR